MNYTTLDQSQKLKEIGATQQTQFGYLNGKLIEVRGLNSMAAAIIGDWFAAHNSDSLIEWLPDMYTDGEHYGLQIMVSGDEWEAGYVTHFNGGDKSKLIAYGATPLEAVIALCVAIKEGK